MKNSLKSAITAVVLVGLACSAQATIVKYSLTDNGSGNYTYNYTVENNTASPLTDFGIYFPDVSSIDAANYVLGTALSPGGWTSIVTQPSAINLGGIAEWYGNSIAPGGTASGFGIQFTHTGSVPLGSQYFEVYDAGLNVMEFGQTQPLTPGAVPEPSTVLAGMLPALIMAGAGLRRLFRH